MNPYEILGIPVTATPAEIKAAYRALAKRCHPDQGGDPAAWKTLQLAYDTLRDPDRRARYDATGEVSSGEADNMAGQILAVLLQGFDAALQEVTTGWNTSADLVTVARKHIMEAVRRTEGQNADFRKMADKLEKTLKRLRFTGTGQPLVIDAFRGRIAEARQQIAHNEGVIALGRRAHEMAAEYVYEVEAAPDPVYLRHYTTDPLA